MNQQSTSGLPQNKASFVFHNLQLTNVRTYLFSALFIIGNVALPYLFHQFQLAGPAFLPIYFFVLIGAYKYGWKVGVITALLSPLANFLITSMPPLVVLPYVMTKGVAMSIVTGILCQKYHKLSLVNLVAIVVLYQAIGSFAIFLFTQNRAMALSDFTVGYPGLLLQIVGGYGVLYILNRYEGKKLGRDQK